MCGQDNPVIRLQAELHDVIAVRNVSMQGGAQPAITFSGRLLRDAETALAMLMARFRVHGYTPLIRRRGQDDVVVAVEGVVTPSRSRLWVNLVLLVATILTTTLAGAMLAGANLLRDPLSIVRGLPFAFTLLLILGAHELGHYFMGRWHGVQVTLPYFIPVPLGLGTFGAFIQMRSPIRNRGALFDVGFAGPLVGFVVALPLLIIGLLLSPLVRVGAFGGVLGKSLLIEWLIDLLKPHGPGYAVQLHPIALAAYFGILITGINLLPILLGVLFFLQQKYMTPPSATMTPEQESQQKIMRVMMIVLFPLMLYSAPSGLSLYILTSSSIGILESRHIRRQVERADMDSPPPP